MTGGDLRRGAGRAADRPARARAHGDAPRGRDSALRRGRPYRPARPARTPGDAALDTAARERTGRRDDLHERARPADVRKRPSRRGPQPHGRLDPLRRERGRHAGAPDLAAGLEWRRRDGPRHRPGARLAARQPGRRARDRARRRQHRPVLPARGRARARRRHRDPDELLHEHEAARRDPHVRRRRARAPEPRRRAVARAVGVQRHDRPRALCRHLCHQHRVRAASRPGTAGSR